VASFRPLPNTQLQGHPSSVVRDSFLMYSKLPFLSGGHHLLPRHLDASVSGWGPMAGCCESGNEPSGSIKCRDFLD
jgi:hypothetical protein